MLAIAFVFALSIFAIPFKNVFAAKSQTPQITEIVGIYTPNIRVHFRISPVKAGQALKVNYKLWPSKLGDVKYKAPKSAKKNGTVGATTSSTGSAIDLKNIPSSLNKYIEKIAVRIQFPGQKWSAWSNTYSM